MVLNHIFKNDTDQGISGICMLTTINLSVFYPYENVPWYNHGATMVYHGKQWYTMVRCNCTMVQITCTMVN